MHAPTTAKHQQGQTPGSMKPGELRDSRAQIEEAFKKLQAVAISADGDTTLNAIAMAPHFCRDAIYCVSFTSCG